MRTAMNVSLSVAVSLFLASELSAQDCCREGVPAKWRGYQGGVRWYDSLEEAKAQARKKKRLLLVHQLVGDMDKQGC